MKPALKKDQPPDFSKPEIRQAYVLEAHNGVSLLHKEIDINRAEQGLLIERIREMNRLINNLPDSDPEYIVFLTQTQMDQIELDELKQREKAIGENLNSIQQRHLN